MNRMMPTIRSLAADEGEMLDVFGAGMNVKADGTDLPFFLADHTVPPGYFVPPHVHERDHETFFILEGALTLMTAKGEASATPGMTVHLPAGQAHGFRNDGTVPARLLVLATPGVQVAEMFRHFDRAGKAATGALAPAEIVGICAQYGVRML